MNSNYRFILGSASPRRKEILSMLNVPFDILVSDIKENVIKDVPSAIVKHLAYEKAKAVCDLAINKEEYKDFLLTSGDHKLVVIGADTIVSVDEFILGKPKDGMDAKHMLSLLSGRTHKVYTGVSIFVINADYSQTSETFYVETGITFSKLSDEEIDWYVSTGECDDKAGAYACQGLGARFITGLTGDYFNVVGLPLQKLYEVLRQKGIITYANM